MVPTGIRLVRLTTERVKRPIREIGSVDNQESKNKKGRNFKRGHYNVKDEVKYKLKVWVNPALVGYEEKRYG